MERELAIDFETHLIRPGDMLPKAVCMSWATQDDQGLLLGDDIPALLDEVLRDDETLLIGHSVSFDMGVVMSNYPHLIPLVFEKYDKWLVYCTAVGEKLLDIALGKMSDRSRYNLKHLIKKWFDVETDKDTWRKGYEELDGVPREKWPQGAVDYAVDDSRLCWDLFENQLNRAIAMKYEVFMQEATRQSAFDLGLRLTSARGFMIDQPQAEFVSLEMEPRIKAAVEEILKHGLFHKQTKKDKKEGKHRKNLKAIREMVKATYPGSDPPLTDGGKTGRKLIKTDGETIEQCDHPGLKAIVELSWLQKIMSTYVQVFLNAKGKPVHSSYDVLKRSGRTSSFKPNVQNQPRLKGIRECVRARKGWVLIACDYDAQEIRTLGQAQQLMLGKSTMADRFQADPDFDPHTDFAANVLGLTYEEAMKLKDSGDEALLEQRQRSKAANFGFPGGMGVKGFLKYAKGYGLNLTEGEAKRLRDGWFKQWPDMKEYFTQVHHQVEIDGCIAQLQSGRIRGGCGFCDAANTYFQGLAADASKSALYAVTKACYGEDGSSPLAGCRPVWFIHDEIGVEAPETYAHEAAQELERIMVAAMAEVCPDVPARATAALMRNWSKKAKPVLRDGRLIPWEDEGKAQSKPGMAKAVRTLSIISTDKKYASLGAGWTDGEYSKQLITRPPLGEDQQKWLEHEIICEKEPDSVKEAKRVLRDWLLVQRRTLHGALCACDRRVNEYPQQLSRLAALGLLFIARKTAPDYNWVHVKKLFRAHEDEVRDLFGWKKEQSADANQSQFTMLRYWGMMEQAPAPWSDRCQHCGLIIAGKRTGFWRVLPKGVLFLRREITVPKHHWILSYIGEQTYDGGYVDENDLIAFDDALQNTHETANYSATSVPCGEDHDDDPPID